MIILAANDTLAGGASAASQVTCTLFGMELASGVETYKVLDQRQLAASPATIYTATANGPTFIRSIMVNNNDTVVRTFRLFRGGTAAVNAITPNFSLLPGGCAVYEDILGWKFFNSSGQVLMATGASQSGALENFGINGSLAETISRNICTETNTVAPTASGTLFLQAIYLQAGITVSNISICSATTAANGPTHWLMGLYKQSDLSLLATSADQTSTAWAANTLKTLAMTTPYLVPTTGLYYIGFMMTASTAIITTKGNTARTGGQLASTAPILAGASSTGLTTALPNPAAAITANGLVTMWAAVT
jgi:hypothetical protein